MFFHIFNFQDCYFLEVFLPVLESQDLGLSKGSWIGHGASKKIIGSWGSLEPGDPNKAFKEEGRARPILEGGRSRELGAGEKGA